MPFDVHSTSTEHVGCQNISLQAPPVKVTNKDQLLHCIFSLELNHLVVKWI